MIRELVLVGLADDPAEAITSLASLGCIGRVTYRGPDRLTFEYRQHDVTIRVAGRDTHGSALFEATGSRGHYDRVAGRRRDAAPRAIEAHVYADAGLPWIPPELREGRDEIEAADAGRLPSLVERRHVRGDLHMHSTYSDGRDSIEAMVEASEALGHEYIAITDHSQGANASRTLAIEDIPRQREEIHRLRALHPRMTILHGIEVDILPDGRLDFPDTVLESFDVVLASLHEQAGQDGPHLTGRCLAAIRHPLVNVITHPANRLPGGRPGYALDFDAIYAAAAANGTALEVDGAPGHLDLDGEHARAAVTAGATLVIDSDCHRAISLERHLRMGVGMARRGWVEPRHVLNTRPALDVLAFIAAKRRRGA